MIHTGSHSIAGLLCVTPEPSIFFHLRLGGASWKTPSLPRAATKSAWCPKLCNYPNEELTHLLEGPQRGVWGVFRDAGCGWPGVMAEALSSEICFSTLL